VPKKGRMRKLGAMEHDECAPWCNHSPEDHHEDCNDSFCDGIECQPGKNSKCFGSGKDNVRGCRCKLVFTTMQNIRRSHEIS